MEGGGQVLHYERRNKTHEIILERSLKIDKSFIEGLGEDPVNDAIVRWIVDFAHTLGLKVTAEGVENERQVASLTAMRCDQAQGF